MKVVITDCDLGPTNVEEAMLRQAGFDVHVENVRDSEAVAAVGRDADALIIQWAQVDHNAINALRSCRIISRYGIGVDNIDLDAASDAGIAVANVDDYCLDEVASHTVALMYALTRGVAMADRAVRSGGWSETTSPSTICNSTVGFLGFGRIAQLVSRKLAGSGATFIAHDPFLPASDMAELVDFQELLLRSDILSLHAPLTDKTRYVIDGNALRQMKETAMLVNTARGGLIDESALAKSLTEGRIAGAGLDVFEHEPLPKTSPLRTLDNVVMTPHIAWKSPSSLPALRRGAAENVISFFNGEPKRVLNHALTTGGR